MNEKVQGWINLYKPVGISSFSALYKVKKKFNFNKIGHAGTLDPNADVNLKTCEIAFDRTCQLACSYCNPAFSSTWVKDIRTNGGYQGIKSDARGHFIDDAPYAEPFDQDQFNPYVDAFWRWWPELSTELEEIRVTGGEPLMTPDIYQLFDWLEMLTLVMILNEYHLVNFFHSYISS